MPVLKLTVTFTPAVSAELDQDRLLEAVAQALAGVVPKVPQPDEEWFMVLSHPSGDELEEARQLFDEQRP